MTTATLQIIQLALSNDESIPAIERQAILDFCGRHNSTHPISRAVQSLKDIDSMGALIIWDKANREFYSDGAVAEICRSGSSIVIVINGRINRR